MVPPSHFPLLAEGRLPLCFGRLFCWLGERDKPVKSRRFFACRAHFHTLKKDSAAALPFLKEKSNENGLFAQGAFLEAGEVLLGQADDHRGKQRHCDEVGDGHHAVEGFGDAPEEIELDGGTDNGNQGIDDHKGLDDLFAEEIFAAASAVQAPAQDGGKCKEDQAEQRGDNSNGIDH